MKLPIRSATIFMRDNLTDPVSRLGTRPNGNVFYCTVGGILYELDEEQIAVLDRYQFKIRLTPELACTPSPPKNVAARLLALSKVGFGYDLKAADREALKDAAAILAATPVPETKVHVQGGMPADLKTSDALMKLIEAAKAKLASMSPEEQQAMWAAQRESWVRGEMQLDRTADRGIPPVDHVEPHPYQPTDNGCDVCGRGAGYLAHSPSPVQGEEAP